MNVIFSSINHIFYYFFTGLIKIEPHSLLNGSSLQNFIKIETAEAAGGGGGTPDLDSTYSPASAASPGQSPPASPGGGKIKVNIYA